ncbi:MAG: hypothetical protein ABI356_01205 [Steroidobacteraceae bacterium]
MAEQVVSLYPDELASPLPSKSGASWPAILAGALVATAISLTLMALGSGLGLSTISPWPNNGISGMSLAVTAAVWLILTQWISAGIGGYLAGRLRIRWIGTHPHEVFFRDTAQGLITWAVASLLVAATLAATVHSAAGVAGHAAAGLASQGTKSAMTSATAPDAGYDIDRLLRPADANAHAQTGTDPRPEVAHIIDNAVLTGSVADGDRAYLAQLIAARTGLSQQDAQKRVDDFIASVMDAEAKAKAAADAARKTAAEASIFLALSLLVGAFIASVSAALGGRLRDEHP